MLIYGKNVNLDGRMMTEDNNVLTDAQSDRIKYIIQQSLNPIGGEILKKDKDDKLYFDESVDDTKKNELIKGIRSAIDPDNEHNNSDYEELRNLMLQPEREGIGDISSPNATRGEVRSGLIYELNNILGDAENPEPFATDISNYRENDAPSIIPSEMRRTNLASGAMAIMEASPIDERPASLLETARNVTVGTFIGGAVMGAIGGLNYVAASANPDNQSRNDYNRDDNDVNYARITETMAIMGAAGGAVLGLFASLSRASRTPEDFFVGSESNLNEETQRLNEDTQSVGSNESERRRAAIDPESIRESMQESLIER